MKINSVLTIRVVDIRKPVTFSSNCYYKQSGSIYKQYSLATIIIDITCSLEWFKSQLDEGPINYNEVCKYVFLKQFFFSCKRNNQCYLHLSQVFIGRAVLDAETTAATNIIDGDREDLQVFFKNIFKVQPNILHFIEIR